MSDSAQIDLNIRKGETFGKVLRWGQGRIEYAAITNVLKRAPCRITAPGHGIPDGWVVRVESVRGIRGLNAGDWQPVTVIDDDTIELPRVNAAQLRGDYAGDGYLVFNKPMDLTGYTGRMQIREYPQADEVLLALTSDNGGIVIDVDKAAVAIQVMAEQSEGLPWQTGVYDLEMVAPDDSVHVLAAGNVTFDDEVTR